MIVFVDDSPTERLLLELQIKQRRRNDMLVMSSLNDVHEADLLIVDYLGVAESLSADDVQRLLANYRVVLRSSVHREFVRKDLRDVPFLSKSDDVFEAIDGRFS